MLIELSQLNRADKLPKSTTFLKKMIHEQVPLPVPCYDLAPLTESSLGLLRGSSAIPSSLGLTGGEYKTQERIHRHVADWRLLVIPAS